MEAFNKASVQNNIQGAKEQQEKLTAFLLAPTIQPSINATDLKILKEIVVSDVDEQVIIENKIQIQPLLQLPAQVKVDDITDGALKLPEEVKIEDIKKLFAGKAAGDDIVEDPKSHYLIARSGDNYYVIYKNGGPLGEGGLCNNVWPAQQIGTNTWYAVKCGDLKENVLTEQYNKYKKEAKERYGNSNITYCYDIREHTPEKVKKRALTRFSSEASILQLLGSGQGTVLKRKKQPAENQPGQNDDATLSTNTPANNTATTNDENDIEEIYLLMEYASGIDLSYYKNSRTFSPAQLINLANMMTGEIRKVHSKGILHCDIKLDNFVFNALINALKLIDNNISRKADSNLQYEILNTAKANKAAGTPLYLAPELKTKAKKFVYNEATEVYAFGVALILLFNFGRENKKTGELKLFKLENIKQQNREWPDSIQEKIYFLVKSMTDKAPHKRPNFVTIANIFAELGQLIIQPLTKIRNIAVVPITEVQTNLEANNEKYFELLRTFDAVWLQESSEDSSKLNFNEYIFGLQKKQVSAAGVLHVHCTKEDHSAPGKIPLFLETKDTQGNINSYHYVSQSKLENAEQLNKNGLNIIEIGNKVVKNKDEPKDINDYSKEILNAPITSMQYDKIIGGLFDEINRLLKDHQIAPESTLFKDPYNYLKDSKKIGFENKILAERIIKIRCTMKEINDCYKCGDLSQEKLRTKLYNLQNLMFHTSSILYFTSKYFGLFKITTGKKKIAELINNNFVDAASLAQKASYNNVADKPNIQNAATVKVKRP